LGRAWGFLPIFADTVDMTIVGGVNPFLATESAVQTLRDPSGRQAADAPVLASPDLMQALGSLFNVLLKAEHPDQPALSPIPDDQLNVNPTHVDTSFADAMLSVTELDVKALLDKTA
jgi:hypothetical protein